MREEGGREGESGRGRGLLAAVTAATSPCRWRYASAAAACRARRRGSRRRSPISRRVTDIARHHCYCELSLILRVITDITSRLYRHCPAYTSPPSESGIGRLSSASRIGRLSSESPIGRLPSIRVADSRIHVQLIRRPSLFQRAGRVTGQSVCSQGIRSGHRAAPGGPCLPSTAGGVGRHLDGFGRCLRLAFWPHFGLLSVAACGSKSQIGCRPSR